MTKLDKWDKVLIAISVLLIAYCLWTLAAGADDSKYQPTEVQLLRLQVKQRDVQLAQKDFFIAQQNFNVTIKELNDEAIKVKTENKWPEGLVFNQEKLSFTEDLKPPAPLVPPGRVN